MMRRERILRGDKYISSCRYSEFYGVTERWYDGYKPFRAHSERAVVAQFHVCIDGVKMAVSVIYAYVPDALVPMFGGMIEVAADV
jgi:hypothetical protein